MKMEKLTKQLQNEVTEPGWNLTKAAFSPLVTILMAVSHIPVIWVSWKGYLFPDNDTLQQLISCCAQIIAGLYGITLAGYTFFLSRIDALMATDSTLDYIVSSVKQRFKGLIWYITFNVAMTLFISMVLMYYPASSNAIPEFIYRLICNEFVLFLVFSTSLILYYSVGVVDPNCLEKEAKKLKKKLGTSFGPTGSAVEFISLYDRIQERCNEMLPETVLHQLRENKGNRFEYTIGLLEEQNMLAKPLIYDLVRIHRYYECMVNCSPMRVSQEMCSLAKRVLAFLEQTGMGRRSF